MRYLFITYVKKPNGQIDEMMAVGNKIKTRDIQMASVIMDFKEKKVDKCMVDGRVLETTFENLYVYYKGVYPSIVDRLSSENGWTGEIIPPVTEPEVIEVTDTTSEPVQ